MEVAGNLQGKDFVQFLYESSKAMTVDHVFWDVKYVKTISREVLWVLPITMYNKVSKKYIDIPLLYSKRNARVVGRLAFKRPFFLVISHLWELQQNLWQMMLGYLPASVESWSPRIQSNSINMGRSWLKVVPNKSKVKHVSINLW